MEARPNLYGDVKTSPQHEQSYASTAGPFRRQSDDPLNVQAWPGRRSNGPALDISPHAGSFGSPSAFSTASCVSPSVDNREHTHYGGPFTHDEPNNAQQEHQQDEHQQPAWAVSKAQTVERTGTSMDVHMAGARDLTETLRPQETKTKAGKDRKRLPLACIDCRRKKIRCSGEKPACKHCVKSRIPCVYKVTPRKATPRTDYMAMLDKRLKRMEDRVIKMIPDDIFEHESAYPRATLKPSAATSQPKATVPRKRSTDEARAPDLDKWMEKTSDRQEDTTSSNQLVTPRATQQDQNPIYTDGKEALPSAEIQEHLTEVYFDHVYGQSYYLLHKPSHMQKLKAGTVPPVLTLAICAVSARFSTHPQIKEKNPPFLRGLQWANAAQELALKSFERPNLTIISVCLMLGLHEFGTCRGGRSWMHAGMAQRMTSALRLHKDPNDEYGTLASEKGSKLSFVDREIRRRCMWGAFMMDRFNSSGTERPMLCREEHMELQLPIREEYFQMEIPGLTEKLEDYVSKPQEKISSASEAKKRRANMDIAAYNVRIVALWGRLVQHMNLGGRLNDDYPMWSNRSQWHSLSKQIRDFKASLPDDLQLCKENLETHAAKRTANQFLFLHIAYNQVVLFLHRYAFPAIAMYTPCKGEPLQFIEIGKKAAIEAATAISDLMQDATAHRVVVPFAGYSAYMSAAIHIYGVFSGLEEDRKRSREYLGENIRFLDRMKQWWGTFHYLSDNLRELYRLHADAARRGANAPDPHEELRTVFQYADWHERYPSGVSHSAYEEPTRSEENASDPVLGQPTDLQSVEDFFRSSSPPTVSQPKGKARKKDNQRVGPSTGNLSTGLKSGEHGQHPNPSHAPLTDNIKRMDDVTNSFGIPESFDRSVVHPQMPVNQQAQEVNMRMTPTMRGPGVHAQSSLDGSMPLDPQLMPPPISTYNGINYDTSNQLLGPNLAGSTNEFLPNDLAHAWLCPYNIDVSSLDAIYPRGSVGQEANNLQSPWPMDGPVQFQNNGNNDGNGNGNGDNNNRPRNS